MGAMQRLIWCAVCATEVGLPLTSWRGQGLAARWGLVGVPTTTCDHCRGQLVSGQMAVAVSSYEGLAEYMPWESEFLTDMDVEPLDDIRGGLRD